MRSILLCLILILTCSFLQAQNNGLLFNGSNEHLVIPKKPQLEIQNQFTVEAWIFANNWKAEQWRGSIVLKDSNTPVSGYGLRCGDNGRLSFMMGVGGGWPEVFSDPVMNEKQWHHVAAVVDNGNMSLYLDGQALISNTYTGTPDASESDIFIGASPGFPDRNFDGIIDEVRIWNVARTEAQIADNTTTSFTGTESGLVAYFPMNEGTGTIATNLVDPNCSGSFINMDETNWVDGYTIPDFDVTPSKISGLNVLSLATRPIRVNVDVLNSGAQTVENIPVQVYLDGELVLTETIAESIAPQELKTYTFFTPIDLTTYNNPEIEIRTALPNDGNALNNSTKTQVNSPDGNTIRLFDKKQHNFGTDGRNHSSSVVLPADLSNYSNLLLHIDLDCPTSGCDPWDQPAKVEAITEQGTFEIARYITPYGIGCGPWTVDITDFKDVLGGVVDFRSFIQVWGGSGWLVTIDLELVEGDPTLPFSKLTPLWETDYWIYGDPGFNDDLADKDLNVDANTESSHIRMTISGHGQGNTNNAAEFYNVTHNFMLNNQMINAHNVWKSDCESNPCANQAGNWLFDRAGWCPGQAVDPYTVNTTAQATAGSTINLDYDLQDYTNFLNTGYNGGSHTEPHYRIWSYFVESSSSRYQDYFNLICDSISAEVSGMGDNQVLDKLSIHISNDGSQPMSNIKVSYFINDDFIVEEDVPGTIAVGESYIHEFSTIDGFTANAYNKVYGIVSQADDENSGDNISKGEINPELFSSTEDFIASELINIYPNPSQGEFITIDFGEKIFVGNLNIFDQTGKLIQSQRVQDKNTTLSLKQSGLYFLQFEDEEGRRAVKKLVVQPGF